MNSSASCRTSGGTDPASVANAKTQLEELSSRYANLLGKDAGQYQKAIAALELLVDVPGGDPVLLQTKLREFDGTLRGIICDQGKDDYYQSVPVLPLLMKEGRLGTLSPDGRPLPAEETMQVINEMPTDELQSLVNGLRRANQ